MATGGDNRLRASDAEREEYAKMLRAAMTEGRLTLEEGEERLSQVYGARFRDELPPLTVDLPDGGRRALFDTPEARSEFERHARRHLARHAGLVVVVGAVLVGLWSVSHAHFFWPAIPLLVLTFSLLRHARWSRWAAYSRGPWARGPWGRGGWGHGGWGRGGWGHGPWAANSDSQAGSRQ
jgi:hypothetical protein